MGLAEDPLEVLRPVHHRSEAVNEGDESGVVPWIDSFDVGHIASLACREIPRVGNRLARFP
jgi:hypothetical protein